MKKIKALFVRIDKKLYDKLQKEVKRTELPMRKLLEILIKEIPKGKKWNI